MSRCFQIHAADNVATMLDDGESAVQVLGVQPQEIHLLEKIQRGHKVALKDIGAGEAVVKFGVRIGLATQSIRRGAWVHTTGSRVATQSSSAGHRTAHSLETMS